MECNSNPKTKGQSKSHSPSKSHTTSRSPPKYSTFRSGVVQSPPNSPRIIHEVIPTNSTPESSEITTLIKKLEDVSISGENHESSEVSEESINSIFHGTNVLTQY